MTAASVQDLSNATNIKQYVILSRHHTRTLLSEGIDVKTTLETLNPPLPTSVGFLPTCNIAWHFEDSKQAHSGFIYVCQSFLQFTPHGLPSNTEFITILSSVF